MTLNKGSKLPDLKKFFNIFKTQRSFSGCKNLFSDPSHLLFPRETDRLTDWEPKRLLPCSEVSVLPVSLQFPGRSRAAYVCRDYSLKKAYHVLGKLCSMLFHLIVTTPHVEGIITHIVLLRKIKLRKVTQLENSMNHGLRFKLSSS